MARRRPRLTTIGAVLNELAYQYRRADRGTIAWQDCAAASRVLREISACLEASDIEARLRILEEATASAANGWSPPPPGHHVEH